MHPTIVAKMQTTNSNVPANLHLCLNNFLSPSSDRRLTLWKNYFIDYAPLKFDIMMLKVHIFSNGEV